MRINARIEGAVYGAIDELNLLRTADQQICKTPETHLFGRDDGLDSLALVSLILDVEERLQAQFGTTLTLADERAVSMKRSPFATVASLVDYIALRLSEAGHG